MFEVAPWTYLPHLFLAIAAVMIHFAPRAFVILPLASAMITAYGTGQVTVLGANWLIGLAILLRTSTATTDARLRRASGLVGFALAVALSDYALPGFHNTLVFDRIRFTPDAVPFSMYFNFDKTGGGVLIALLVIGATRFARLGRGEWTVVIRTLAALITVMLPTAVLSGHVTFEPKFPAGGWVWAANNLVFVCLAEEALYRGFLLEMLLRWRPNQRAWTVCALIISSVAFGLAHHRTGVANVALAAFAGLFYGFAYLQTRRIHASMLVHFGLNLTHFGLFTYPSLGA